MMTAGECYRQGVRHGVRGHPLGDPSIWTSNHYGAYLRGWRKGRQSFEQQRSRQVYYRKPRLLGYALVAWVAIVVLAIGFAVGAL